MGAGGRAVAAPDALAVVGGAEHLHIHFACLAACPAGSAFAGVDLQTADGDPVEQAVERPQGADPLAEGAVAKNRQRDHPQQDAALPGKQSAQAGPDAGIGQRQRDAAVFDAVL